MLAHLFNNNQRGTIVRLNRAKFIPLSLIVVSFVICLALISYARGPVISGGVLAKEVPDIVEKTALKMHLVVEKHAPISAEDIELNFQIKTKLWLKSIPRFLFREPEMSERGEQYVLRESDTGKEVFCKVRIYGDHVIGIALSQAQSVAPERINVAFSEAFEL
ncbi:MAG: hypothetical protein HY253_04680 [Burkholderiales bacterium]|nr:hypothetical protein [Burkholderiales bacterium]